MPKSEDTQALSTRDIQEASLNYKPRRTPAPQPQPNTPAVQVALIIMLGFVALALISAATYVVVTLAH